MGVPCKKSNEWIDLRKMTVLLVIIATFNLQAEISPDYKSYEMILSRYVSSEGLVDYQMLQNDRESLDQFVRSIGEISQQTYQSWDEQSRMAFLINSYNALVVKIVVDHYPVRPGRILSFLYPISSIKQIAGAFNRMRFTVAGGELTLEEIAGILGKEFAEPRVHFAMVAASRSCPPLRQEPYTGDRLEFQLDEQTRRFIDISMNFRIDPIRRIIHLSQIFRLAAPEFQALYGNDEAYTRFRAPVRGVIVFISSYLNGYDRLLLSEVKFRIQFGRHDWVLNSWL